MNGLPRSSCRTSAVNWPWPHPKPQTWSVPRLVRIIRHGRLFMPTDFRLTPNDKPLSV